ncbi:hypothetical protein Dvar_31320 [Desulfosarcina variabilis str. Montpellier]|uniref:ribbon-helix-helix protein, CopG family n=1 Tax=Desulfosarcina variabilis TaxID=2300 RepID=UPI003AFAB66A
MASQLVIRIDDELKQKVTQFAMAEGKNASQVVREMLEHYVTDRDIGGYIDSLWQRIGNKLIEKGVGPDSIEEAILSVRRKS